MTTEELRYIAARSRLDQVRAEASRVDLYDAIRAAAESGMTVRAIAGEVGLSYQRVAQILSQHTRG